MEIETQLIQWLMGNPLHNPTRDECCPDFSCCGPKMAPGHERLAFYMANDEARMHMLVGFLSRAFESESVYVAGNVGEESA